MTEKGEVKVDINITIDETSLENMTPEAMKKIQETLQKEIDKKMKQMVDSSRRLVPRQPMPSTWFADEEGQRFPINDSAHCKSALVRFTQWLASGTSWLSRKEERDKAQKIHDRIIHRCNELQIDTSHHHCELCKAERVKVMLT